MTGTLINNSTGVTKNPQEKSMGYLSGVYFQIMGSGSKLIRFLIFLLVGVVIWKLSYYAFPQTSPSAIKSAPEEKINVVPSPLIRVTVFYEALCPDSRDFVVRQLLPAYRIMGDVITVELVPYGKAQSSISPNGRKTFTCQHGPRECQANIMHACVSKHVKDEQTRLNIIECMIKINYNEDPIEAGRKCLNKFEENFKNVEKCATAEEGEELHYHLGKMTHDLEPRVTFIPTITINDSQKHQELILKNLVKKLCLVLTGPTHPACGV
ncbi:UNVERIFIED_CONTAM: hypothetical protein RMT77_015604 [Armadillidium vulgare]